MISHNRPTLGIEEIEAARRVIESGYISQGHEVEQFENEFCEYMGYKPRHSVAVSSGSAALYLAILANDMIKRNDTVCIPAYSCSAVRNAVLLAEKKIRYIDVTFNSPNISPEVKKGENEITIVCHMFGMPTVVKNNDIIEDCAQSMGSCIKGKKVGGQADIGVFSFYATKLITSGGEGGMIVAKDENLISYIKDLRDFDMKNDERKRFNFKMTDLAAAIGREQLKKTDEFIERRHYLAERYEKSGIHLWNRKEGCNDYRGLIMTNNPRKLLRYLAERRIEAIIPIEEKELLCDKKEVPNSYTLTQKLVSIPLYPTLREEDQDRIIEVLQEYIKKEKTI